MRTSKYIFSLIIVWCSYIQSHTITLKERINNLSKQEIAQLDKESIVFIHDHAQVIQETRQLKKQNSTHYKPQDNALAQLLFTLPTVQLPALTHAAHILDISNLHNMALDIYVTRVFSSLELRTLIRDKETNYTHKFDTKTQRKFFKNTTHIHEIKNLYHDHMNMNISQGCAIKKNIYKNSSPIIALSWHPHKHLCAGIDTNTLIILKMPNGHVKHTIAITNTPTTLAWTPHDALLAIGYTNGEIDIFSAQSGKKITSLHEHTDAITGIDWRIDQRFLVSASADKTARLWDTRTWKTAYTYQQNAPISAIACNPFEKEVALGSNTTDTILKMGSNTPLHQYTTEYPIHTVSWSPDSHEFLISSHSKQIDLIVRPEWKKISIPTHHIHSIACAAWSPDSHYIATGSSDGTIEIIDALKRRAMRMYDIKHKALSSVSWSPSGTYLATADAGGNITLLKFMDKKFIHALKSLSPQQMQIVVAIKRGIIQPFRSSVRTKISTTIGTSKIKIPFNIPDHLQTTYTSLPQEIKSILEKG